MQKLILIGIVIAVGIVFFLQNFSLNNGVIPVLKTSNSKQIADQEIVAQDLEIPWEIVFLPSGEKLVAERPGRLLKIGADKKVIEVSGVKHIGEGGLLGIALDPQFASNKFLYLYLTSDDNGRIANRVERYILENDSLSSRTVILQGILGSSVHDGGRIAFGPDGLLYVTTGDAGNTSLAQNKNSLNGKILRINADGSIPKDNPFNNAIYSMGHRNVQGITWDSSGQLWATEHGRSGIQSGFDELNKIQKGGNYGWPTIQGDETRDGMITNIINSGANETWAPSGMEFVDGNIYFAGLRGASLYRFNVERRTLTKHLKDTYGRLRTVKLGPDGFLYVLTNNRDGRGIPKEADDKIIRVSINAL